MFYEKPQDDSLGKTTKYCVHFRTIFLLWGLVHAVCKIYMDGGSITIVDYYI